MGELDLAVVAEGEGMHFEAGRGWKEGEEVRAEDGIGGEVIEAGIGDVNVAAALRINMDVLALIRGGEVMAVLHDIDALGAAMGDVDDAVELAGVIAHFQAVGELAGLGMAAVVPAAH